MTFSRKKATWLTGVLCGLVVVLFGIVYLGNTSIGPLKSPRDQCREQARAVAKIASGLPEFHEFPAGMKPSPQGIEAGDSCGPGDNRDVAGSSLDLVGTPASGTAQSFYAALFAKDGWTARPKRASSSFGCSTHSKEVDGTVFYADVYSDTTRPGSPFVVDVSYSLGNAEDFGC